MDRRGIARRPRRSRLLGGALVLATAGASIGSVAAQAQHHLPTARVLVSIRSITLPVHRSGPSFVEQAAASYADVARTPLVLEPVISELRLRTTSRDLAQRVSSTLAPHTMVIAISVAGGTGAESADIANAISRHLVQTAGSLSPAAAAPAVRLTQIEVAKATG